MNIKLSTTVLDLIKKSNDIAQKMVPLLSEHAKHAKHAKEIIELTDKRTCIDNEIGRCIRGLVKDNDKPNAGAILAPSRFKRK